MEGQKLLINGQRLRETLESFADFGRTENNGVTRLALSEEDRQVRDYFCECCKELGMEIDVDDIGNIYATLPGKEEKPPVFMGSHLDSVKKGGRFDGVLGVVAGLEVVRTLVENNIVPRIPITIVNFTNEEGARFEPSMMSSGILSGNPVTKMISGRADAPMPSLICLPFSFSATAIPSGEPLRSISRYITSSFFPCLTYFKTSSPFSK